MSRGNPNGRAVLDRTTVHVHDITAEFDGEFPESRVLQQRTGTRTILCTPLLREGTPIGVITIRRTEVRPFTEKQIELLKIFADQAVIAIENVRLFNELKESLEQQTATSEILGVIASSPTDIQPVLDAVAESAAKLCDAADATVGRIEGNLARIVASYGSMPVPGERIVSRGTPSGRAILDRNTIHVPDLVAAMETEFPESRPRQQVSGARSVLAAPLLREGVSIGVIFIRRRELRPFSDKQIKLLETFADQAVIAIENVRLFQELQARNHEITETLQQQTATSKILEVIASSPTDLQPVMDTIAESAARLCDAHDCHIRLIEGTRHRLVASCGLIELPSEYIDIDRSTPTGRAVIDRQTIHVNDLAAAADAEFGGSRQQWRTFFAKANSLAENLRRSGGYRNRKCPLVQGIAGPQRRAARGTGASNRNIGGA
jgi:GAF domain-containing protein